MTDVRPNILWISLEDCSPRLGCYGDSLARTPHLDRLAGEGCLYASAFSTSPVCAPARCAIITGMYAASIGGQHMRTTCPDKAGGSVPPYECVPPAFVKCFPEYLRAAGYFCSNNDKTDYQFSPPFTMWDEIGREAHWRQRAAGSPFFAVFNLEGTHESGMWSRPDEVKTDPAAVTVPPYLVDAVETRLAIARHYDNFEAVDQRVGELLWQLEEDGLVENTVVMVWSDHGEGLPRGKRWPYDSGLRVPLIVRQPGCIAGGEICQELISTIDLGPTVLSLAGIPVPVHMQGRPFLGPQRQEFRTAVFSTQDRFDRTYVCARTVRDARWRYLSRYPAQTLAPWTFYGNKHPAMRDLWNARLNGCLTAEQERFFLAGGPPEELYDLQNDPYEIRNLAGEPARQETVRRLRALLETWQRETGDLYAEPEDQMARRFWPDFEQPVTKPPCWVPYDREYDGQGFPESGQISLTSPALLQIHDLTQGASIGYRLSSDPAHRWRLYTEPLALPPGSYEIEAKAIRIGYRESPVQRLAVTVLEP